MRRRRLAIILAIGLAALPGCRRPAPHRPEVPKPPRDLVIAPYEGRLGDEPRLADALERLPEAIDDATFQIRGALGLTIDRPDRLRVVVEDGAGRPGAWAVTQTWTARIRTWRISIRAEPLARGDRDLEDVMRAAMTEAMLAENEILAGVTLPGWVKAGAPLYISRLGDRRRAERRLSATPDAPPDAALTGYTRWLYLERTFGPRRVPRFLPALLAGQDEIAALEGVFGRSSGALVLEWALFEADWLAAAETFDPATVPDRDHQALSFARSLLRLEGREEAAAMALADFIRLYPDSPLVDEARGDLARLHLDSGAPRDALEVLGDAAEQATGTPGTRVRDLAFEAATLLAWDGLAADILAREIELNGVRPEVEEQVAALAAREALPASDRQFSEIEAALALLTGSGADDDTRREARLAIRRIGVRAIPVITRATLEAPAGSSEGVALLEELGGERAVRALEDLVMDGSPECVSHAVPALLRLGADPRVLGDRLLGARSAWPALRALRDATGRADRDLLDRIPDLAVRMASPDAAIRSALAEDLGDCGVAGATSPLELLARTDVAGEVRLTALRALGRLGEPGLDVLENLLGEETGAARLVVIGVLLGAAPERAITPLRALLDDPEPRTRAAALTAWSAHGAAGWVEVAIESLSDSDAGVRRVAEAALQGGSTGEVVPLLIAAYDTDPIDAELAARLAVVLGARAKRDFGHEPGLDPAGRRAVADRMKVWWESARGE